MFRYIPKRSSIFTLNKHFIPLQYIRLYSSDTSSKRCLFFASEVSGLTGDNQYMPYTNVLDKIFLRSYKDEWNYLLNKTKEIHDKEVIHTSKEELVENSIKSTKIEKDLKKTIKENIKPQMHIKDVRKEVNKMIKNIEESKDIDDKIRVDVKDYAKSAILKEYGIVAESRAVNDYREQRKIKIKTDSKFYMLDLGPKTDVYERNISLGGRVDGFADGKLVEIKNRTRKFFNPLPAYDIIQFQCYLHVLNLSEGELVQRLKNVKDPALQSELITRDDEQFNNRILPALQKTANTIEYLINNEDKAFDYINIGSKHQKKNKFLRENVFPHIK